MSQTSIGNLLGTCPALGETESYRECYSLPWGLGRSRKID